MATNITQYIQETGFFVTFVTLQLLAVIVLQTCNVQCPRFSQLLLNRLRPLFLSFFFANRDWAGLDWIWSPLLIAWDHYAV